jgi:hypothetical protein
MLHGCLSRTRRDGPGPEQMIKESASCQRASSRKSGSEPPTADYEKPAKVKRNGQLTLGYLDVGAAGRPALVQSRVDPICCPFR